MSLQKSREETLQKEQNREALDDGSIMPKPTDRIMMMEDKLVPNTQRVLVVKSYKIRSRWQWKEVRKYRSLCLKRQDGTENNHKKYIHKHLYKKVSRSDPIGIDQFFQNTPTSISNFFLNVKTQKAVILL